MVLTDRYDGVGVRTDRYDGAQAREGGGGGTHPPRLAPWEKIWAMDLSRPDRLFRALALAEVITWTLLLLGMLGKYVLDLGEWGVRVGGGLHGFVFIAFCLVTLVVAVDRDWGAQRLLAGWASAVIPYATVPFERYAERHDLLAPTWRLRSESPRGGLEQVTAWLVRHPIPAVGGGVVAVAAVFSGLLALGPPTEWFAS